MRQIGILWSFIVNVQPLWNTLVYLIKIDPGKINGEAVSPLPMYSPSPVYDKNSEDKSNEALMRFLMSQGREEEKIHFVPSVVGRDLAKKRSPMYQCSQEPPCCALGSRVEMSSQKRVAHRCTRVHRSEP